MKKIVILFLAFFVSLAVGCEKQENKITTVTNIEIGKEQFIEQLKNIKINNSNDYIMITSKVKWDSSVEGSFEITVPYSINVDGISYSGSYILGDTDRKVDDENPKYDVTIKDLTTNYETKVLINNK